MSGLLRAWWSSRGHPLSRPRFLLPLAAVAALLWSASALPAEGPEEKEPSVVHGTIKATTKTTVTITPSRGGPTSP
jgi:hypothetical protein